ncbi:Protein sds23 [Daldinia childiae]|uniref:Protein sds23 n=1 Tax=Daldinia childiae TaxID=326645 RepID=UPI001444B0D6|nr:Protein sds23 [Daldinia childiae]KAF3059563.1 Protein sds23 [Daldinia childiae]
MDPNAFYFRGRKDSKETSISPPPPQRTGSSSSLHKSGHVLGHSHRSSLAENLRGMPPSPRNQRHPSFTQSALQELLNHPPAPKQQNPRFAGRDWRDVAIGELVSKDDVSWVELDTGVQDATMALLKNTSSNVVIIRENATSTIPISTFDYNDLNAYILVVVGLAHPSDDLVELYDSIARRAQARDNIPLRDIQPICRKESLITLQGDEDLAKAIEIFGSGVHRVLVRNHNAEVIGILSQLKLLEFFWHEGINFRVIDDLYPKLLREVGVGSQQILAVNADSPLTEALNLMNQEGLSSVAVVDNALNVVGNISTADVKLLTNATSIPLLQNSCMHFISVILTEEGVEKGKDSFPDVDRRVCVSVSFRARNPVARPHRVRSDSIFFADLSYRQSLPSVPPASTLPGSHLSGRLIGVVTLTDVLNLFARSTGLNPSDPSEQRARRRRSSSSSVRPSIESTRASLDIRR